MPGTQTRSHKSKATSKAAGRNLVVSGKSTKGNPEIHPDPGPVLGAQERERLVAQAAYFRAEKRGFAPGCELQDWVEAEAEVLRLIGSA